MVQVVRTWETRVHPDDVEEGDQNISNAYGVPLIHVHLVERHVHGNAIALRVYGEMKIAAKERVYARELKLNTIQTLLLTIETGYHYPFTAMKWIYHKGEYDNYASIDIFAPSAAYQFEGGTRSSPDPLPSALPHDGSIWVNFIALGE